MITRSKYAHDSTLYLIIFDYFGAVGKPSISAYERHQNRQKRWGAKSRTYFDLIVIQRHIEHPRDGLKFPLNTNVRTVFFDVKN